jgi:hypothetical protein
MTDNWERANRLKMRWETSRGALTAEDLWDLSLQSLDEMAKKVNKTLRDEGEESFIPTAATNSTKPATNNDLRLEILKHVIGVKVQEQEDKRLRSERLQYLSRLEELAATKANEKLASQSLEDIQQEIARMKALV